MNLKVKLLDQSVHEVDVDANVSSNIVFAAQIGQRRQRRADEVLGMDADTDLGLEGCTGGCAQCTNQ